MEAFVQFEVNFGDEVVVKARVQQLFRRVGGRWVVGKNEFNARFSFQPSLEVPTMDLQNSSKVY